MMTKEENEDFENSTKCWISDNDYTDNDVKVRDHCHTIRKYRASGQKDCNINLKLNYIIFTVFCNLKKYDYHLIIQELNKLNLKINVIPIVLEKYLSFTTSSKLSFIDSFQFLSFSLDTLFKNLDKNDLKYLLKNWIRRYYI